ncbi:glucose-1-phosphate adenylyltransferase [Zhihengliuella salsuginis]|uniref:Glucose-1-phosphate adenylyltransferase n=2 Tax=Zhihengliuella salsuginis TaxID=578222 RepID=A0ABQ3GCJ1_9MICC|nr:glucose-1-phosphate adenylyltransferase [Zhihengliuella salsuginis]GHD01665.1 glucose-1-phosphate adenylyltransferase [Zhihengliuella salsuginis]
MPKCKVLAVVLAGGEGKRLMPLTVDRAKPAVPFAGEYRLVDFALSNVVNSGYRQVVVLTQYKSHSLDRHISETWRMSTHLGNYVASVPAQQRLGKQWFLGSANAIFQSLNLIHDANPDYVLVVGADHVYRMDFSAMLDAHIEAGVSVSVAAVRQPLNLANQFGVIQLNEDDPQKIAGFIEKPETTAGLEDDPSMFLASMGNYIFTKDALIEALTADNKKENTAHDMGGDIIPEFVSRNDCAVYDFSKNPVPGEQPTGVRYWRDVGSLDSYYDAHMDLLAPVPAFDLYNKEWPIFTRQNASPPAKLVRGKDGTPGTAHDSLLSAGVVVSGGTVEHSVLSGDATVLSGAKVTESVILGNAHIGADAVVHRAILDKNTVVPAGARIGVDHDLDRARGFLVTDSGLTVLSKGQTVPVDAQVPEEAV